MLPLRPVEGVATCVRVTGAPGELSRWTRSGVELLRADTLAARGEVRLGGTGECPQVASQPNGAAIAAAVVRRGTTIVVRVALREPGGEFGAPSSLIVPSAGKADPVALAVAISSSGDAVVAVDHTVLDTSRHAVLAFRRPAGAAFLPAQQISPAHADVPSGRRRAAAEAHRHAARAPARVRR